MKSTRLLLAMLLAGVAGLHAPAYAQDELRGPFRLSRTTTEIGGAEMAQGLKETIAIDEELQWQVYVPENYDRQKLAGAFVFVDPSGWGGMPDQFRPVFDSLNMIWIGANRTAATTSSTKSMWTTVLGARALQQDYAIDLNRLYLGGTGEGVLTAINAMLASSEFAGVVQISGSVGVANIPAQFLDTLKRKHFVFMTSTNDKANKSVRADYDSYRKAGFENVKLIYDVQGSRDVAKPELIDEAIRYLDARLN
ncbi:MAG: hypothetical protein OEW64_02320 [Gammaproteobacteria bacterium]|nr:hypothetical protein [Gammaproteobacteria bacterium]MDH5302914.1 hypothetical protein [Gammaproteobacteria bacterium]MDH5321019.1 hypothetical protein [Gammaproteobacteria bacterium]